MPAPPRRGRSVESARKRSTPNARPRDILSINRVIFGRYPASTRQNSRSRYLGKRPFHFKNSVVFGRFIETFQKKIFFVIPHGGSCVTVISSEAPARRESLRFNAAMPFRITERFLAIKNAVRKDGRRFFPTKSILPKASPTNSRAGCQRTAPFLFQTDPSGNSPLYTRDFCCCRVQSRTTTP